MTRRFLELRVAALAAGELTDEEAPTVRAQLARDPRLARMYGDHRALQRALHFGPEDGRGSSPALRARILARTLPEFRRLYRRRNPFLPAWVTAAAAALVLLMVHPPEALESLDAASRLTRGFHQLRAEASRRADRVFAEFSVLRASLGVAVENRLDRMGDRLREVERATRRRDDANASPARQDEEMTE